jgi:ring-1,2-phenylacetyl-CoA epoxidase subunit PaaE
MPQSNYHQLRISQINTETKEAKTFVLQPLNNWQPQYRAGQFLTLVFNTRHGEKRRSYSISSAPALGEPLSITVKRVENGEFSRMLLAYAKEGDILNASGINGLFLLPEEMPDKIQVFFLAAGSGITPCYPLIKTLLNQSQTEVVLIYSNKSEEDAIFLQALQLLQQQFNKRFFIQFLFSNKTAVYQNRLSKWLLQQLLHQYLHTPPSTALFFLCGPVDYMQTITITLLSEGIPKHAIRKENFNTFSPMVKRMPPDKAAHLVTLHLNGEVSSFSVQYPQSVLSVAKSKNIAIPYSCEAGRCGSCAATCIKGKVWMAYNEVLMDEEIAAGRILCCQAYPAGGAVEIVVDYINR